MNVSDNVRPIEILRSFSNKGILQSPVSVTIYTICFLEKSAEAVLIGVLYSCFLNTKFRFYVFQYVSCMCLFRFSVQQCADIFGPQFNQTLLEKAVEWTNTNYGALALKVTPIYTVYLSVNICTGSE